MKKVVDPKGPTDNVYKSARTLICKIRGDKKSIIFMRHYLFPPEERGGCEFGTLGQLIVKYMYRTILVNVLNEQAIIHRILGAICTLHLNLQKKSR